LLLLLLLLIDAVTSYSLILLLIASSSKTRLNRRQVKPFGMLRMIDTRAVTFPRRSEGKKNKRKHPMLTAELRDPTTRNPHGWNDNPTMLLALVSTELLLDKLHIAAPKLLSYTHGYLSLN
jgi:hypothetical protein